MENLEVTVGNTVDFYIDVEGLSDSPTEAKIEIYSSKVYPDGLADLVITHLPVSITGITAKFVFDTELIAPHPKSLYGRFFINDNGKKINAYFKIKFVY